MRSRSKNAQETTITAQYNSVRWLVLCSALLAATIFIVFHYKNTPKHLVESASYSGASSSGCILPPHPDGTMVRDPNNFKFYRIENQQKREALTYVVPDSYTLSQYVRPMNCGDNALPDGPKLGFRTGTFLKANGTYYAVADLGNGQYLKRPFSSLAAMNDLGYSQYTDGIFSFSAADIPASPLPIIITSCAKWSRFPRVGEGIKTLQELELFAGPPHLTDVFRECAPKE